VLIVTVANAMTFFFHMAPWHLCFQADP